MLTSSKTDAKVNKNAQKSQVNYDTDITRPRSLLFSTFQSSSPSECVLCQSLQFFIMCLIIIIIIHEFHRDASLETKLQGRSSHLKAKNYY